MPTTNAAPVIEPQSPSAFKFDANQGFQLDAVQSVVDLFDGQPLDAAGLVSTLHGFKPAPKQLALPGMAHPQSAQAMFEGMEDADIAVEVGAIGNHLILDRDTILANLQRVQDRNGLEVSERLAGEIAGQARNDGNFTLDFDIEMETGTGKTYVYLRTIFELASKYNFTKFIILVPSVAIREGVRTSIDLMRSHFRELYPALPFDAMVYSGKNAEEVQSFATNTSVQILIMTIDSVRGTANTRIIHQTRDKLNGLKPIDYLRATHPVVIMDEPQNMESLLSQSAVAELDPVFTLRYSATHKKQRNVVYRLDPVDAHRLGLVKQIVVADVAQDGADATPYIKLISVKNEPEWVARLELACRKADGSVKREQKNVWRKRNKELSDISITGNPVYEGWRINEMTIGADGKPGSVEFTKYGLVEEGETIGEAAGAIYQEMIRETLREHLRKEAQLRPLGIKVLSLFFVDRVAGYLGDGASNLDANGDFVKWFDEIFVAERQRAKAETELTLEPADYRKAYFSQIRTGARKGAFQDSSGTTQADDDAYDLIMRDKARLLDESEPARFIFSHSALREGWDNPNVFQICTLREMGGEVERRQTLGRGLRLPVKMTPDGFERVPDKGIASLTVIANESYNQFAEALQKEYTAAGVDIGRVRRQEFSRIAEMDSQGAFTEEYLGFEKSKAIWEHLAAKGFIDANGVVQPKFQPQTLGFSLDLPREFQWYEEEIIDLIHNAKIGSYIKPKSKRKARKLNKQVYLEPWFEEFWEAISQKTTYRVTVSREQLIEGAVAALKAAEPIEPLRIQVTRAGIKVQRGGAQGEELGTRSAELRGSYDLPDIIGELAQPQEKGGTGLTRRTIIEILRLTGRLGEFIHNPNDFITLVKKVLNIELAKIVGAGIQYEKIAGSVYELRELQADGAEEKDRFVDQLVKVTDSYEHDKTDFDYVLIDSEPERQFAELLNGREDIRFFMKLPAKFLIPTPVGPYNPDWAIIKREDGEDRIYMIRETKSTLADFERRPKENAKIQAARKHFEAIGIPNYGVSVPGKWNL